MNAPTPTGALPVTMIPNVSLEEFEKAVYARDHERASQLLLQALRRMKAGGEFIGYALNSRIRVILYSRFCAAVIALLADPTYSLSQEGFDQFASEHAVTDAIFRHSVFGTSDHMLPMFASNPAESDMTKLHLTDGAALVKFLLTYSMQSGFALNFEETFRKSPQVVFSLWAGMLSALLTISQQAQDRHELLLGLHDIFANVKLSPAILPTLSDAYMYTSYGLRRDKHAAKATIHRLFAKFLADHQVPLPSTAWVMGRRKVKDKRRPTILICTEWFTGLHAMYRCYAPIIRQLRSRFRVIGMSRAIDTDEIGKAEFDEWREVKGESLVLGDLIKEVADLAPDIIYYPSLGMAMWWVIMASVRLAPIQMMTLGHPASSQSPCIDYVVCEDGAIGDSSLFSERIVTMPFGSARYVMRHDAAFPEPVLEDDPPVVRIAVPAMLCKLNARFMVALRRIAAGAVEAGRRVEFHFFVNMIGINLHQAAREIREYLPDAFVYERQQYNAYLDRLRACHLHLCTFPFGGTNSNIDSMLLGIPILAMEGNEPHERFDAMQIRRAGLGEEFIADTVDRYVARAVELVVDHAQRNAARDLLLRKDLRGLFFGEPEPALAGAFLNAVECIFNRHEHMQASEHRVFKTHPDFPVVMSAASKLEEPCASN